ncbi:MAG TPA: 6,7-dimethyl-8-ribityllumazine synthase [Gaiellaceae bacterium]|nr:6,7-dimethyl-8-ribityllumazine synthase [Gaiellaceae bacterium]
MSASEYWPGEQRQAAGAGEGSVDETAVEDVVRPAVSEDTEDFDDPELDDDDDPELDDDEDAEEDDDAPEDAASAEAAPEPGEPAQPKLRLAGHAPGDLDIPDGIAILEGAPLGSRRGVGIVAARFNGEVTNRLLESAFAELERAGVGRELITVMPVPGAFELPLGAMALAKTRRYACIVALGCVIRGETAHFDYVAGEAASGLQLAALETGVPVAFGVLTVDTLEQAEARADKGAEAVRTALEMADLFAQLRASAKTA